MERVCLVASEVSTRLTSPKSSEGGDYRGGRFGRGIVKGEGKDGGEQEGEQAIRWPRLEPNGRETYERPQDWSESVFEGIECVWTYQQNGLDSESYRHLYGECRGGGLPPFHTILAEISSYTAAIEKRSTTARRQLKLQWKHRFTPRNPRGRATRRQ